MRKGASAATERSDTHSLPRPENKPKKTLFGGDSFLKRLVETTKNAINRTFRNEGQNHDSFGPDPLEKQRERLLESHHEMIGSLIGSDSSGNSGDASKVTGSHSSATNVSSTCGRSGHDGIGQHAERGRVSVKF